MEAVKISLVVISQVSKRGKEPTFIFSSRQVFLLLRTAEFIPLSPDSGIYSASARLGEKISFSLPGEINFAFQVSKRVFPPIFTNTDFYRIPDRIIDGIIKVFFVANIPVKIRFRPKFSRSVQDTIGLDCGGAADEFHHLINLFVISVCHFRFVIRQLYGVIKNGVYMIRHDTICEEAIVFVVKLVQPIGYNLCYFRDFESKRAFGIRPIQVFVEK